MTTEDSETVGDEGPDSRVDEDADVDESEMDTDGDEDAGVDASDVDPDASTGGSTDDGDPEPTTGGDPSDPARPLWPKVAAVALVAIACVAGVIAMTERGRANEARAELDTRSDARLAAASFAEAYLSYDYTDVQASQARLAQLATPSWLEDFEATRLREVDDLFSNIQSRTVAETTAVYLGDVSDVTATALVVVDVAATSSATGDQSLTDLTFLVDLIRVDDVWRVDRVAPPPQANVGGGLPEQPEDGTTETSPDGTSPSSTALESTEPESTEPG